MTAPALNDLTKTIRVLIEKGDKARAKAEDFYIAAGQHLKTLKAEHNGNSAEWERLLKERCGIGKSRAYELIKIADGRTTVEEVRAEKAESVRRARAAIPLRSGKSQEPADPAPITTETVIAETVAVGAPTNAKSWRVEVLAKDGRRFENGVRLQTEEEADRYRMVFDIRGFWDEGIIVVGTVVTSCEDEPNCGMERTKKGKITHRLWFPHGGCSWLGWTEVGTEVRSTTLPPEFAAHLAQDPMTTVEESADARKAENAAAETPITVPESATIATAPIDDGIPGFLRRNQLEN